MPFYFSNNSRLKVQDIQSLSKRTDYNNFDIDNNFFYVISNQWDQFKKSDNAVIIINGLVDKKITSNFGTKDLQSCQGDYSFFMYFDDKIIFGTDAFGTHSLYFYQDNGKLSVSTSRDCVNRSNGIAMPCLPNTIYIFDKVKQKIITKTNVEWNFEQKTNHFDDVFESFERSIKFRSTQNHCCTVSTGLDSKTIWTSIQKQKIKSYSLSFVIADDEYDGILQNESDKIIYGLQPTIIDYEKIFATIPSPWINKEDVLFLINQADHLKSIDKNIIISGIGGNEIYGMDEFSKTLQDLSLSWKAFDRFAVLQHQMCRYYEVFNSFDIDTRYPLLDKDLVQSWLNTSVKLKNHSDRYWMKQYIKHIKN